MRLTTRERAVFARIVETVVAPAGPLPRVRDTDAIEAFEHLLDASPATHRAALRAAVITAGRKPSVVKHLEPLRATAALAYYGDPQVQRILGYDP